MTDNHEIITALAKLVREYYVFEDVGETIATNLEKGSYDGLALDALAETATRDLQKANGDKHLRLRYHPEGAVDEQDEAEWLAAHTAKARKYGGGIQSVQRLEDNVAVLAIAPQMFPPSIAGTAITAAMNLVADADHLILDLRGCRGGFPETVMLICTYLFGDEQVHLNDFESRHEPTEHHSTLPYVPGPRFGPHKRVSVLTSEDTFSGGEDLAYTLQQAGRATVIGERTGGGAHPVRGFRLHDLLDASIPVARTVNVHSRTNWEGTGVAPDIEVPADQALHRALLRNL